MSKLLKKIEGEGLGLSYPERAFLADRLLSSLGADGVVSDIEAEWIMEAEQRYSAYKDGRRPGVSAQDVFHEADLLLK